MNYLSMRLAGTDRRDVVGFGVTHPETTSTIGVVAHADYSP